MSSYTDKLFETPIVTKEQLNRDRLINRTVIDLAVYSSIGFLAGGMLSIFFKRKAAFTTFSTGFGCGLGFTENSKHFKFNF